jgi:hypothetical protein
MDSSNNYFNVLQDSLTNDDETVVTSNKSQYEHHCDNVTVSTCLLTDDDTSIEEEFVIYKFKVVL